MQNCSKLVSFATALSLFQPLGVSLEAVIRGYDVAVGVFASTKKRTSR
jgi:hypothetical protein